MKDDDDPRVVRVPRTSWTLLEPIPPACSECGADHMAVEPHNPESVYWQTKRYINHEPPPTWRDALAHCPPDIRAAWEAALRARGVDI
jgi:hypothetical protein